MTEQKSTISRRTVAKGIAWSAPVLAVAGTAPAFAVSGPKPRLEYQGACKFSGQSCSRAPFGYAFIFKVTNNDTLRDVYFCGAAMSGVVPADTFGTDVPGWKPPASGCVKVPAGATGELIFYFKSTNSANKSFTTDLTVKWSHECDCNDGFPHGDIVIEDINVDSTPPGGSCKCNAEFIPA